MPLYDIVLIVKPLAKPELVHALKEYCGRLFEEGALIAKLTSLGYRDLPYRMFNQTSGKQITGSYFMINMYAPTTVVPKLYSYMRHNGDILHYYVNHVDRNPKEPEECTLHDELQPPAYRKSVAELQQNQRTTRLTRILAAEKAKAVALRTPKSYFVVPTQK